jgi:zinc protease
MRELAFTRHTYSHTTMGYLEDIEAMPGYYEYSLRFFDRYYRPDNAILLVVGDLDPEATMALAEKYWGGWEPGYRPPEIAIEPPQTEAKGDHIDWTGPIGPHLMVGYRAPAFSDATVDTAALDIISQLLFSDSAPLHQKLVVDEQWVDFISGSYSDHRDPYLFTIFGRATSDADLPKAQAAIAEHLDKLKSEPVDEARLERIKSHLRYSFALGLDSPGAVAFAIAGYLNLTGDTDTVNRVYEQYQKVTPDDVLRVAQEVFRDSNRTTITLSYAAAAQAPRDTEEGR